MPKSIKAWGLRKCDTTMKALDHIKSKKVTVAFTDYSVDKPAVAQIEKWMKVLGGWEKMINRSGYTWRGLPTSETEGLDDKKAAKLFHAHTSLIRRPLIEYEDGSVTVGFAPKVKALF
jgi:arsenate reductase (glutaredoxin)